MVHVVLGVGLSLYVVRPSVSGMVGVAFMGGLGAFIPDMDLYYNHRATLHNIPLIVALSLLLTYVLTFKVGWGEALALVLAFTIGYLSHILGDLMTVSGVALLYPFTRKRFRLARVRYDSPALNAAGIALGLLLMILWAYKAVWSGGA